MNVSVNAHHFACCCFLIYGYELLTANMQICNGHEPHLTFKLPFPVYYVNCLGLSDSQTPDSPVSPLTTARFVRPALSTRYTNQTALECIPGLTLTG